MTQTQYFWGWVIYLFGAAGCQLSLWLLIRHCRPRIKRPIMMFFAVLLFLPGIILPGQAFWGPAFLNSIYDGLSDGVDSMWRSGQAVVICATAAFIAGLLMPVGKTSDQKPAAPRQRKPKARRQEPSYQEGTPK